MASTTPTSLHCRETSGDSCDPMAPLVTGGATSTAAIKTPSYRRRTYWYPLDPRLPRGNIIVNPTRSFIVGLMVALAGLTSCGGSSLDGRNAEQRRTTPDLRAVARPRAAPDPQRFRDFEGNGGAEFVLLRQGHDGDGAGASRCRRVRAMPAEFNEDFKQFLDFLDTTLSKAPAEIQSRPADGYDGEPGIL